MHQRILPGTDLSLSVVGMGCWAIGKTWWGDDVDDAQSRDAIRCALDQGINWFDTAPLYGHGHADTVLSEALGNDRHSAIIATKVGVRTSEVTGHATSDLSPAHIRSDTEASLKRLRLDTIPLLQVHWPCEQGTPLEDSMEALRTLQQEGKVRHIGLCNYDADTLLRAAALAPIVSLQTPYSMVRRAFEHSLRDTCAPTNSDGTRTPRFGVLAYETLCRGLLTGKFGATPPSFPESDMRAMDDRFKGRPYAIIHQLNRALAVVAKKAGVPQSALASGWAAAQPGVTAAIVGAKTPAQVEQNVLAARVIDRQVLWDALAPYIDAARP